MAGTIYAGTYTSTILLTNPVAQNPVTLTGDITVYGTNASSDSGFYGAATVGGPFTIDNLGHITATGPTSYGIALLAGGTIVNGGAGSALGVIQSDETGILLSGANPSGVTNDGTIIGTAGRGVFLQDGGTLVNGATGATTATILGGFEGVAIYNAGGVLTNAGTIRDTGSAGFGAELYAGVATNLAGGQIGGVYGIAFVAQTLAGTLVNAGTITGTGRDAAELSAGGTVGNSGAMTGAIAGVLALGGVATVTNSGVIAGGYAGLDLLAGGTVTNQAGATLSGGFGVSFGNGPTASAFGSLTNAGTIDGARYQGVSMNQGGTVLNTGSIYGAAAGLVAFYGAAMLTNDGRITGHAIGVDLAAGGTLTNQAGASITASYGVVLGEAGAGTIALGFSLGNAGTIIGTGTAAARILTGGVFTNQAGGMVDGGRYGVYVEAQSGTVANYGSIGGDVGVYTRQVVTGGSVVVPQITIINAGTIDGSQGVAVSMFSSQDLLIDRPGAVFQGGVVGGGARLELAAGATGTLGALVADLSTFGTVTVDGGADWVAGGTIAAGATLVDSGTFSVHAQVLSVAGTLAGTGTVALSGGGTVTLGGTAQAGSVIDFADSTGHAQLVAPMEDAAAFKGFAAGDTIWLSDQLDSGLSESYGGTAESGTLTIAQNGSTVALIRLDGSYTESDFALVADPHGGTDVLIPCFLAGTRIATPAGEVAAEQVRPGMQVVTASGALRRVIWVGARWVDVASHDAPDEVRPVCVAAHAFGPGRPARDLFLSPDHAVFHGGTLIPVHLLVNGGTVRRGDQKSAQYHHIELDRHDLLLAEGLAVESYLDTGNRCQFQGRNGRPSTRRAAPCAPLALRGPAVARARRHLLVQARARAMDEAWIAAESHGVRLRPARCTPDQAAFLLPAWAEGVRLLAAAPCRLGALLDGRAVSLDPGASLCHSLAVPASGLTRSLEVHRLK
jgi:hypothetical protein